MRHLVQTAESFIGIDSYINYLNHFQSLADFILDASSELLVHADKIQVDHHLDGGSDSPVNVEEVVSLDE